MSYYARAIEIVSDPGTDYRKIAIEIAKKHPKVICDAVDWLKAAPRDWMAEVKELIRDRKKLNAIKLYRDSNGTSLVVSKSAVEDIAAEMGVG